MRVGQHLQSVIVLSVDDRVERLVTSTFHSPRLDQSRIDAITELCNHHEVLDQHDLSLGLFGVQFQQVGHPAAVCPLDPLHSPQPLVARLDLAPGREHPDLIPATYSTPGQFHSFRLMLLEDQAECPALHQSCDLRFEVLAELGVDLTGLPQ